MVVHVDITKERLKAFCCKLEGHIQDMEQNAILRFEVDDQNLNHKLWQLSCAANRVDKLQTEDKEIILQMLDTIDSDLLFKSAHNTLVGFITDLVEMARTRGRAR